MKSYGALAGRYLKQQRRKSVLTIIGIILSVALISALGTMGQALKDNAIKQQMYEDGSFHYGYSEADSKLYDKLEHHALVDQFGSLRSGLATPLEEPYELYVYEAGGDAFELLPIHLKEGRLPQSGDEVIVEEWVYPRLPGKPKLGEAVTLNGLDGKPKSYKLVGILLNESSTQADGKSRAFSGMNGKPVEGANYQLFLSLKPGVDISGHMNEFGKLGKPFFTNDTVLTLIGEGSNNDFNRVMAIIFGTLIGLVVLSTVAVIYNSFHISVLERIRQFGLLRTLGATPRQIRSLVLREATMLAVIGIPAGLALGWGGLYLVLWIMMQSGFSILQMDEFRLTFHWWIMGISVGVGIASVYLAAWLPARKASRVSPVEAVKGAGSIVRESFRRARIPSLLHLIGIEGKMASKNIRRNRSKFRTTTFSIVVSIILFIVFHYFTQEALNFAVNTNENGKIAFEVTRYLTRNDASEQMASNRTPDIVSKDVMERIAKLPGVEGVYGRYSALPSQAMVSKETINPEYLDKMNIHPLEIATGHAKKSAVGTTVHLYDDNRLRAAASYLKSGTADPEKLAAEGGVLIVQTVKPFSEKTKKRELMDLTRLKVGDTLSLQMGDRLNEEKTVLTVKVAGILSENPFGDRYGSTMLTVIGTKSTFEKLMEASPEQVRTYGTALLSVEIAMKDGADPSQARAALKQIVAEIPGGQLIDIVDRQKQDRQFALQMSIFVYSFLAVIGLIGSLNIINTVQTNLFLRRREFGLLQAVGMTQGQLRRMATSEGIWFGVIGSFWGLLLGGAASYFLFVQLTNVQGMPFEFPWGGAVIACGFAIGVGLLAVQGPLRRISKANLIETLREEA